jgi:hypothetical protein
LKQEKTAPGQEPVQKNRAFYRIFRSDKVLIPLSLFLAVWVWLVLIVGSSEVENRVIENIQVKVDFGETVSESLGLQAFWPQNMDPLQLTVDVTIQGKKYDISPAVVTAEDLQVELLPKDVNDNDINSVGDYQLKVQVTPRHSLGQGNYAVVDVSPATIQVYFDHYKEATFVLEAAPVGIGVDAPQGYYAGDPLLSRSTVTISGPAKDVNSIKQVKAQFLVEKQLTATQTFNDVQINPIIDFGAVSQYLTIDTGGSPISVTIPVWKRTDLKVVADFKEPPKAYIDTPLRVTYTPATLRAALPEESIPADGNYAVGQISFRQLSPANHTFRLPAADLKEIHLFDAVEEFRADVDMTGMAETRLTLSADAITVTGGKAAVGEVRDVVVVGPADIVAALTPELLQGEVVITAETPKGSGSQPVNITVNQESCWVYAPKDYMVACVVN